MILQFGFRSQIDNLVTLIGTNGIATARTLTSLNALQAEYHSFIKRVQHRAPGGSPGCTRLVMDWNEAKRLRPLFINDSLLDDKAQASVIAEDEDTMSGEKLELVARALDEMGQYSHEHRALFDTIITDIFVLPSNIAKAGSTSQAIGVIWANPRTDYVLHDVVEILVHEMTHHALFIDELRFSHYSYEAVVDKTTWAHSAILSVLRPLDKVLHSAVVAMEILLWREQYIGHPIKPRVHPPTPVMLAQLTDAISSVERVLLANERHQRIFRQRAWEIFDNVKRQLSELSSRFASQVNMRSAAFGFTAKTGTS